MTSAYSNLFKIEVGPEVVRIVFEDQRAGRQQPAEVSEVVMTRENAKQLSELLTKLLAK